MNMTNNSDGDQLRDDTNNNLSPFFHMSDLGDDPLVKIALFLPAENKALFIIGNYISDEAWKKIMTLTEENEWETLDFGRIPPDEASKITDEKLSAVFDAVDAQNTVKTLRLTGCVNLYGRSLRKIQTSRVIEEIDLNYKVDGNLDIVEVVNTLHILLSWNIDDHDSRDIHRSNMLKVVLFPISWLLFPWLGRHVPLSQFFSHYYRDIIGRDYACISCNRLCVHGDDEFFPVSVAEFRDTLLRSGVNRNICTWCRSPFCANSNDTDEAVIDLCSLNVCAMCSRTSCSTCDKVAGCHFCFEKYCHECFAMLAACPCCLAESDELVIL